MPKVQVPRYSPNQIDERPVSGPRVSVDAPLEAFGGGQSLQNVSNANRALNQQTLDIVVREKQPRSVRIHDDTIEMALDRDVHCLVTFNSIAATEALLYGKPAFTLGPNAAQSLCYNSLALIETPKIPTLDEVEEWAAHLSYCQFTPEEIASGFAWKILNEEYEVSNLFVRGS